MNHKITIKNLGPIKKIKDFEVKNVNAVIGESAAGKSLLAKAIYAFNEPDFAEILSSHNTLMAKEKLEKNIRMLLSPYTDFNIIYSYGNGYTIEVDSNKLFPGERWSKGEIPIIFSLSLEKHINNLQKESKRIQETEEIKMLQNSLMRLRQKKEVDNIRLVNRLIKQVAADLVGISEDDTKLKDNFLKNLGILNTVFIPAERNFVFDFDELRLERDDIHLDIDNKSSKTRRRRPSKYLDSDIMLNIFSRTYRMYMKNFDNLSHKLMRGRVEKTMSRVPRLTVDNSTKKLNIFEISSGQRELFPILMILQEIEKREDPCLVIIEEPEANIFPTDQKLLLDRIIEFANNTQSKVFLTTHSPYILMAMNNLIEANTSNYKKLKDEGKYINFDETNMQILAEGKSESILDQEDKLIDMSYIEKIETEIVEEFQKILHSNNDK